LPSNKYLVSFYLNTFGSQAKCLTADTLTSDKIQLQSSKLQLIKDDSFQGFEEIARETH
jgi:hypothetical protein